MPIKTMKVYVDGSWKAGKPNISGWACIILDVKDNIVYQGSGVIKCVSRQIDGELFSVIQALGILQYYEGESFDIYYDYAGIEAWATGKWKAKSDVAKDYVDAINEFDFLHEKIRFVKVKSHSGDFYNELVDRLAQQMVDNYNYNH